MSRRVVALLLAAGLGLLAPGEALGARQQLADEAADAVRPLLAMLSCRGDVAVGAGIIVAAEGGRIHVATASHVVRPCPDSIRATFRWSSTPLAARLLRTADPELDLAVLVVDGVAVQPGLRLPFDRLADAAGAKRGDPVYALGNARGEAWSVGETADRFVRRQGDTIFFSSASIAAGHSGGALLDDRWQLLGMVVADAPPTARAIGIDRVLATLRSWKIPVALRPPYAGVTAGHMLTCVLRAGLTSCAGNTNFETGDLVDDSLVLGTLRLRSLSAGAHHLCGVALSGGAVCFGSNQYGQLGNGSTRSSETGVPVQGGQAFTAVIAGGWHSCGLDRDGAAHCWGAGSEGRLGNDSGEDSPIPVPVAGGHVFKALGAGLRNTCGLTTDGAAWCWGGIAGSGQPRSGTDPPNAFVPRPVGGGLAFRSLAVGAEFACGLTPDGAAYCWGSNEEGQLGNGSTEDGFAGDSLRPRRVASRLTFTAVTAGLGRHACALTEAGEAWCWGWNEEGELGNGARTSSRVPVPVAGALRFVSLSVGHFHTCGVTIDDRVYCWGGDGVGGLGTGTRAGSTRPVPYGSRNP